MARADLDFTPDQVNRALLELVAHGGDADVAAEALIDDEFQVPAATLRRWQRETHVEQYRRLADEYGRELERRTVEVTRRNVARAAAIEADLLEDMRDVPKEQKPQALRAVADAKAKGIDKILALTGRAQQPQQPTDFERLLELGQAKGWLKVSVEVGDGGAKRVENVADADAVEEPS